MLILPLGCTSASAPKRTVLFLCQYGGAKSVMAASYFNRLAEAQGLPYVAVAAAAEEAYDAVPPPVVELLARDGIDVQAFKPHHVEPAELDAAARVVAIDCSLEGVEKWDDVPKVSEDLEGSAAAIRRHIEALVKELRHPSPGPSLRSGPPSPRSRGARATVAFSPRAGRRCPKGG